MRIGRLEICDLYGTREFSLEPGTMTVLSGENGCGKSSIIKTLLMFFDGGHRPGAIRRGAKKGHAVLELQDKDGKFVARFRKVVTEKGSTLTAEDENGTELKAPQSYLDSLAQSISIDPARLLAAKPKELVAVLLELMPLTFAPEEIRGAVPDVTAESMASRDEVAFPAEPQDLAGMDAFLDRLREDRKVSNRLAKDADGHMKSLQRSLPGGEERDWSAEYAAKVAERERLSTYRDKAIAEVDQDLASELEEIQRQADEAKDRVRAEAAQKRGEVRDASQPQIDEVTREMGVLYERAQAHARSAVLKDEIEGARKKYSQHANKAERLTTALEALDDLKRRKLESLPVPGLEVRGEEVLLEGIQFENVNTARRVQVAFQICALRSGNLPFLVIDNSECLDTETWMAFQEAAKDSGFQVIAARVGLGPLTISTDGKKKAREDRLVPVGAGVHGEDLAARKPYPD